LKIQLKYAAFKIKKLYKLKLKAHINYRLKSNSTLGNDDD